MDESSITQNRRSRRSPVLLSATVEFLGRELPVVLRNLSSQGALIEGGQLPPEGALTTFRRKDLVVTGQIVRVERLVGDVGAPVEFTEVLLTADDAAVRVGTPLVEGVRVRAEIVAQGRAKKILVFKKKRRKNYRRRRGHRQSITTLRVTEIA